MARTKKEIDKDLMYKKLMPSAVKNKLTQQEEPGEEPKNEVEEENAQQPAEPEKQTAEPEDPPIQRRQMIRREIGVPSMNTQSTVLVNAMESIVIGKLDSVLSRFKCCQCDRCKKDIIALSLNKLPAKYKVLREGQSTRDPDPQTNAQVLSAMIQAVLVVRDHPRH